MNSIVELLSEQSYEIRKACAELQNILKSDADDILKIKLKDNVATFTNRTECFDYFNLTTS